MMEVFIPIRYPYRILHSTLWDYIDTICWGPVTTTVIPFEGIDFGDWRCDDAGIVLKKGITGRYTFTITDKPIGDVGSDDISLSLFRPI